MKSIKNNIPVAELHTGPALLPHCIVGTWFPEIMEPCVVLSCFLDQLRHKILCERQSCPTPYLVTLMS